MTKKEFVLQVTEALKANPRQVLAGHGINSTVLQTIVERPDVLGKLANVLYSTVNAKKGAAGLKKAANFKISGYKSFGDFNARARQDVEDFIGGLGAKDAAIFTNSENILTILMLPDTKGFLAGEEGTVEGIIGGKSVALTFDSAVRKEYAIAGGMYLTLMLGDSVIRPAEVAIAARKEKVNKKKQTRRTPAQIKAELKAKANRKLAALDKKRADLQELAFKTKSEISQFGNIADALGAKNHPLSVAAKLGKLDSAAQQANASMAVTLGSLTSEDKRVWALAQKYWKAGKRGLAKSLVNEIGHPELLDYLANGPALGGSDQVDARRRAIKNQIAALTKKGEQLLVDLSLAPDAAAKASVRSSISRVNGQIKQLRAKLGTYKDISPAGMNKKAKLLAQVNADIEANIAAGNDIKTALTAALQAIDAKAAEKQIIKQQVIQQVANGMPMQFAVQQAIQDNIVAEDFSDTSLSGDADIMDLMGLL